MIIICKGEQIDDKKLKKVNKVIISYDYAKFTGKRIIQLMQLLPDYDLLSDYCNGDISGEKYRKKYIKSIEKDDEICATLVLLMMGLEKNKDLVFMCSPAEMELGYIKFICEFLYKAFGAEYITYKKWKKKGSELGNCVIDKKALKKSIIAYKDLLNEEPKKVKKKAKTIDDLYEISKANKKKRKKKIKKNKKEKEKNKRLLAEEYGLNTRTDFDIPDDYYDEEYGLNRATIDDIPLKSVKKKHIVHIVRASKNKR